MARKVIVVDDIDGSAAAKTIKYSVDGIRYQIDLSEENAAKFHALWAPYVNVSQRIGPESYDPRRDWRPDVIRTWAAGQGLKVAPRGRIPRQIVDRYNSSHVH